MSQQIEDSRRQAEAALARLRQRVEGDLGWAPRLGIWVLPLAALAVGATIAWRLRRRVGSGGSRRRQRRAAKRRA